MIGPVSVPKFLAAWLPALVVSASVPRPAGLGDAFVVPVGGVPLPVLTCALGAIGVLLARPLARRAEQALPLPLFLIVTAIMLITVLIWIIDNRPPALFAFVVAIGLGFSGFSLIEMVGRDIRDMAGRVLSALTNPKDGK